MSKARLARLERSARDRGALDVPDSQRSDDEEADTVSLFLWGQMEIEKKYPFDRWGNPSARHRAEYECAWWDAAEALWQEGRRDCPYDELRSVAMPVWLKWKTSIVEHRTGVWVYDDPPTRGETIPIEEYRQLPYSEQMRLLQECNQRRGHWKKVRA